MVLFNDKPCDKCGLFINTGYGSVTRMMGLCHNEGSYFILKWERLKSNFMKPRKQCFQHFTNSHTLAQYVEGHS